tara:strand:- start:205 stop:762 length:558 start_codon:yes stop_codon:yes gene_type:complete
MVKKNACVFISGKGSNLKRLIENSFQYNFPIKIALVVSNNKNAKGLVYARKMSIPFLIIKNNKLSEVQVLYEMRKKKISVICLAGYMKILSKNFIYRFGKVIINIHPSILPKFKGLNTFKRILKSNEKKGGCTVHFVNEKLDSGNIILKKSFYIKNSDDEKSLKNKTQILEHKAYSEALRKIFSY